MRWYVSSGFFGLPFNYLWFSTPYCREAFSSYLFLNNELQIFSISSAAREICYVPARTVNRLPLNCRELVPWRQDPAEQLRVWRAGASSPCSDLSRGPSLVPAGEGALLFLQETTALSPRWAASPAGISCSPFSARQ